MSTDTKTEAENKKKPKAITLKVVYGITKLLEVAETETIGEVKRRALSLFGIDESQLDSYVLRAKVDKDKDEQLDEAQTVSFYDLHNEEKVTLAAGSPFGAFAC